MTSAPGGESSDDSSRARLSYTSIASRLSLSSRQLFLGVAFVFYSSASFFLIQYDRFRTVDPNLFWGRILAGDDFAPIQYRVGLAVLTTFIAHHLHFRINQSLPLLEASSYAAALALLCLFLCMSSNWARASMQQRAALAACFAAVAQFPIIWIFPWDRPETLPTTLYLAAIAVLVQIHQKHVGAGWLCLVAVLVSAIQSSMRAEIPVVMGAAIIASVAFHCWPASKQRALMAIGSSCAVTGAAVQLYLQRIAYPQAVYPPGTSKFQLLHNLNPMDSPAHGPIFVTAMLPFFLVLFSLWRRRMLLEPVDKVVLLACLFYIPIWFVTGLLLEVRVYVPFLFLATPTMAKVFGALLSPDTEPWQRTRLS